MAGKGEKTGGKGGEASGASGDLSRKAKKLAEAGGAVWKDLDREQRKAFRAQAR